jgi:hypothetical protein
MILISLEHTGLHTVARCETADGKIHVRQARNGAAAITDLVERLAGPYTGQEWVVMDHPELKGVIKPKAPTRKRR